MANAALAYRNLADGALVFASSQELTMPVALLQDPHVSRRWRSLLSPASVVLDFGALVSVDTVAVMGMTMSDSGTAQVRLSTADSSGLSGDAFSGSMTSVDADYGMHLELLPAPVSARYLRIDMTDVGADYVEAGRVFAGLRTGFTYNHIYGWSRGWTDRSIRTKTRGGQTQILRDNAFRSFDLTFDFVTEAQLNTLIEVVDRENGQHDDILLIRDPESDNLARDSIWGLVSDLTAVTNNQALFDIYSKQIKIEERL